MPSGRVGHQGGFRLETLDEGWLVGRFAALDPLHIPHLVTTRQGPDVQAVRHDTDRIGEQISRVLNLRGTAFLKQVHGGEVLVCESGGLQGQADGLCTTVPGLGLMGKSGDCPLVLMADRGARAVGFAHASWRATVAGVVPSLVDRMKGLGCRAQDLVACICPSVGPDCYEVGQEVVEAALRGIGPHAQAFFRPGPVRPHFDLWAANVDALRRCGVQRQDIHVAGVCTVCHADLFPSHRREGPDAGRFAAVIGIRVRP
ncbi:MAG: polyphenol oxidase family protein [Phycisphaerae bacterium]|nr:polyphenol oxidase family protein [Phycisphaerae bacterium]